MNDPLGMMSALQAIQRSGGVRFVVHRLDPVKGDSYWSPRTGRWVSELDGDYQTYGNEKVALRVAAKRIKVGWDWVDVVQDPAQKRAAKL